MQIKIETGIPVPQRRGVRGELKAAVMSIEVGQSVFYPAERGFNIGAILALSKLKPKKFTTRTVDGGYRIWRIE